MVYSSQPGRYLQRDPEEDANPYVFEHNDPINANVSRLQAQSAITRTTPAPNTHTLLGAIIAGGGAVRAGDVGSINLTPGEVAAINRLATPGLGGVGSLYTGAGIAAG